MTYLKTYLKTHMKQSIEMRKKWIPPPAGTNFKYCCIDEFVLANGKNYTSKKLTKAEWKFLIGVIEDYNRPFPIKQCFYNSQMLVTHDRRKMLKYVEGICLSIIPVPHGWITLNGKVIDLTMRLHNKKDFFPKRTEGFENLVIGEIPPRNREY